MKNTEFRIMLISTIWIIGLFICNFLYNIENEIKELKNSRAIIETLKTKEVKKRGKI